MTFNPTDRVAFLLCVPKKLTRVLYTQLVINKYALN